MGRLSRKEKKRIKKMGCSWNKNLDCLIFTIKDNGSVFRGTMFESKYVGGIDAYEKTT